VHRGRLPLLFRGTHTDNCIGTLHPATVERRLALRDRAAHNCVFKPSYRSVEHLCNLRCNNRRAHRAEPALRTCYQCDPRIHVQRAILTCSKLHHSGRLWRGGLRIRASWHCRNCGNRSDCTDPMCRSHVFTLQWNRSTLVAIWGYRFLHRLLLREGFRHNWKLTYRLYREECLHVQRRRRTRRAARVREPRPATEAANHRWSMDLVSDAFSSGRRSWLTIVDDCTREWPAIEVDTSLPATRVIEVLERLRASRGLPQQIVVDNGPEFRSRALDQWAYARGVQLVFIEPGQPVQNAFVESFNGTFRFECLDAYC